MITIISGSIRRGKSSYATYLGIARALDGAKRREMLSACVKLRRRGFDVSRGDYALYANYPIIYEDIQHKIDGVLVDPFRLGAKKDGVFIKPHSTLIITEAQTYYSSNMVGRLEPQTQKYFFESGHFGIDIILDCPRGETIAPDIRKIAHRFIYIIDRKVYDNEGKECRGDRRLTKYNFGSAVWTFEEYENEKDFCDRKHGKIRKDTCFYNIFDCYNPFENFEHYLPEKNCKII